MTELERLQKENDDLILRNKYNRDAFDEMEAYYKKENNELRGSLGSIQDAYLDVEIKAEVLSVEQDDESNTELAKANYMLGRAIGKTPAQSLAEVKAEAVNGFIDAFRYEFEGPRDTDSIESFADNYANKLKGGE